MVVLVYPAMGPPDQEPMGGLGGMERHPGARGCTPQACGYRDRYAEPHRAGALFVGPAASWRTNSEAPAAWLGACSSLVSDSELALSCAPAVAHLRVGRSDLLAQVTSIVLDGRIERVFYPVFRLTATPSGSSTG